MHIKTGDNVVVLAGKDRGKTGKVTQVFPSMEKVIVEGINKTVKHLRGRGKEHPGKKVEYSAPLHISNVARVDEKGEKKPRP
ncbi:MAG: 50S ribosomal protein L24 [Patescibacteria group bacterium]